LFKVNRTWKLLAVLFLLWSGIASAATLYYHQEAEIWRKRYSEIRGPLLQIKIIIDYDNETIETYPEIYLFNGANVLDALRAVAQIDATYYEDFNASLVNSVNDVVNNAENNNRWWVFSVNGEHALVSADKYKLSESDVVEWIYYQY